MIPVTSFAGKTVAVFGLGGSGLASCHALKAGGAEVIAGDDGADKLAEAAHQRAVDEQEVGGHGLLIPSFRGDAKHRTTMCNCTSENLEIPGSLRAPE